MPDAAQPSAQPELPSPYQAGKRRGRTRRTHTVAKVLLATLLTLGMVSGLSVAFLYRHLNGNLNVVDVTGQLTDRPEKVHIDAPKQPINILVMGSDSRDCNGCKIDGESGGGSDTTILFHLSADRQSAYGVSIPRDSLVDRPECETKDGDTIAGGTNVMWNAAYSLGGPACTIQQFEQTTGIKIDNYVVVDFGSFQQMVDAVDGVEVCVPEDIDSSEYGITIPAGTRTLDGKEALAYVRVRHGVGDGSDIGRIKRQQAFIGALVAKVLSSGTLTRFDRLVRFLNAATKSLTTDIPNIKDMALVGLQFKHIGLKRIRFITVPFVYSTAQPGRVEWTSDAQTLWDRIKYDKPLGKLRDGSIGANQVPSSTTISGSATSSSTESPSGDESSTGSSSPSETSTTESPSGTSSPSDDSSDGVDATSDDLAFAGLCT
ncbi:MAG TPA: LCP family protein [Nocardioides sp.]|uniref:LCP family protein n=1 Tax=Nocardioides sp. TaxID=35761 RepID=UPI002E36BF47|nr:LCP family protein [Nocardioides sp.]HEX5088346.1 LCP family protein [Nocardioides sp.]